MTVSQPGLAGYRFSSMRTIRAGDRANFVRIYEQSFPRDERDDADSLLRSIADGDRECWVVHAQYDLVALAVLFGLSTGNIQCLEYFAVAAELRNQGVGSRFLRDLRRELASRHPAPPGIVFEVESPNEAVGRDQEARMRRIRFYERNSATILECAPAYRAPNLAGEGTIAFLLMWLPISGSVKGLEGGRLRDCVRAILTESYELAPDDPLIARVLDQLTC